MFKKNFIYRYLQQSPMTLDADKFTAMRRKRYYWGNFPRWNYTRKEVNFNDFVEKQCSRHCTVDKLKTLTTNLKCLKGKIFIFFSQFKNNTNTFLHLKVKIKRKQLL